MKKTSKSILFAACAVALVSGFASAKDLLSQRTLQFSYNQSFNMTSPDLYLKELTFSKKVEASSKARLQELIDESVAELASAIKATNVNLSKNFTTSTYTSDGSSNQKKEFATIEFSIRDNQAGFSNFLTKLKYSSKNTEANSKFSWIVGEIKNVIDDSSVKVQSMKASAKAQFIANAKAQGVEFGKIAWGVPDSQITIKNIVISEQGNAMYPAAPMLMAARSGAGDISSIADSQKPEFSLSASVVITPD